MLDDPVIRTELRELVDATEPVTVQPRTLRQIRRVFTALDRHRATVRRLTDRVENCEARIKMLRRLVEAQTNDSAKRTADYLAAVNERDEARAERDRAVLERDNTLRELHATEEQVQVLLAERTRLHAELAEMELKRAKGAA